MDPIERKLIAVLCADVKDYSQHMQRDEDGTIHRLNEYRRLFDQTIADHKGRIANTAGDSVVAEFASVREAVSCAVQVQNILREQNQALTPAEQLHFRIGIHLGDVIRKGNDILGDGVNIAARIESTAEAGGIALSGSVYDSIRNKLPFRYEFQGEQSLKNITEPVRVYKVLLGTPAVEAKATGAGQLATATIQELAPASQITNRTVPVVAGVIILVLVGLLVYVFQIKEPVEEQASQPTTPPAAETAIETTAPATTPAAATRLPNSVAVLPFENMSPDPNNAYFADGLHEEILNQLAKIKALNVIARTTMRQYANTDKSMQTIADELNVETVMEGSVRYADNQVRVTAQLINPTTGVHLWSETYEHVFKNIFTIESDIAMNVANALEANFSQAEREAIERVPTQSPEAYALYLEAKTFGTRLNPNDLTLALAKINQALELDPEFALAWVVKARLHSSAMVLFPERTAQERIEQEQAAQHALALATGPDLPEAHFAVGKSAMDRGDWLMAQAEMDKAIALGGSDVPTLHAAVGHIEKALQAAIEVQRRDLLNPSTSVYVMTSYSSLGDTQAVLREYTRGKSFFPDASTLGRVAALCLLGHGDGEQAREIVRNDSTIDLLYRTVLSDTATVEQSLSELHGFYAGDTNPIIRISIAALAAFLGDQQLAMRAIKAGLDDSTVPVIMIWQPVFRKVRQLDEFKDYMREIGLVAYWREYGWPDLCKPVGEDDFECE